MQGNKASACLALCQRNQWNCTLFDYRGHGQSSGEAQQFTLNDWLEDTLAVLDEQQLPTVLIGSSMGAWLASCAALQKTEQVRGLLLLAAAPDFVQELIAPRLSPADIWDLQQGQTVSLPNEYENPYPITQAFLDSAQGLSLLTGNALHSMQCPVRLIHGTKDTDVPYDFSTRLLNCLPAQHDARLTLLHDADHRLSDASSLAYIEHEITHLVQQVYG